MGLTGAVKVLRRFLVRGSAAPKLSIRSSVYDPPPAPLIASSVGPRKLAIARRCSERVERDRTRASCGFFLALSLRRTGSSFHQNGPKRDRQGFPLDFAIPVRVVNRVFDDGSCRVDWSSDFGFHPPRYLEMDDQPGPNSGWYRTVPPQPFNVPGCNSRIIKASSGTWNSHASPNRLAATNPKRR